MDADLAEPRVYGPRRTDPRATSSTVSATAMVCASNNPASTRIYTAPACKAEPLASNTPTNAPGNVTSPTVRV